ncbi:PEP-CTERM sorting domain-containing protein [Rugamonas sp.]|uniref:PEP-CTERM sorting domain-containing protein n=1 Tax=Rugamonas sp. TaxID=1926287 RepID=UPI0025F1BED4|nr:PEP-CTERM sorting domain-containing protein [Rugamonas sp.]
MKFLSTKSVFASAVMLLAATAAHAELTVYTSQASYQSAVGKSGVDTFNDLDIDERYDSPMARTAGGYDYSVGAGPKNQHMYPGGDDDGDWWLTTSNDGDGLTFSKFGQKIVGTGGFFFTSDMGGYSEPGFSVLVTGVDSTGATLSYEVKNSQVNSFLGFVSTASMVSLTVSSIHSDADYVWPTVDNFELSVAAVPEPSTYAMLLGGLGLLGVAARRRKQHEA